MLSFLKNLFTCCGSSNSCCSSNHASEIQDWSGQPVRFDYFNPAAQEIFIAGDFNNWSTSSHKLTKDKTGRHNIEIKLHPGRYQYKFVVDGKWMVDQKPTTLIDNSFGTKNSVIDI